MAKKNKKRKKKETSTATVRLYRDAETGRFVTKKHAKKNRGSTLPAW